MVVSLRWVALESRRRRRKVWSLGPAWALSLLPPQFNQAWVLLV
jgi:hypothetical protein